VDWSHFGLSRRPFRPAVDTGSYFATARHEAALAAVSAAYDRRDAGALVHGAPGLGKSLLARLWLERLPEAAPRVVLANHQASRAADLLQAILFDLNLPHLGQTEQELRLAVTEKLLAQTEQDTPLILFVDEAQTLGPSAIEELRLLGNIESANGPALFTLLAAQPNLEPLLKFDVCAGFAQRLGAMCSLEAFTVDESAAYLAHQLSAAGGDLYEVFDGEAVTLLTGSCRGVPRLLNRAATFAAELAVQGESETIDVEAAMEAVTRLGLDEAEPETLVIKRVKKSRKAA
jgi:type II secretory pathway predicted ATPase ExeA